MAARLFFIGLWNFADDNGVLEHKPKQIKARVFPGDEIDVKPLIAELVDSGLVLSYAIDDQAYLCCKNLGKHQYIDSPRKSNLPPPHESEIIRNHKKSKEILSGREGKGKERKRKGREKEGTPPPASDEAAMQPVFSCDSFEVSQEHLDTLAKRHPEFPESYLLAEFFPRMADWCLDHRNDPAHRKKFDEAGRLREPRRCLSNWLKREDSGKADPYRRPQAPAPFPPDPPGMQTVYDPACPICRGGGRDRDGPCRCGRMEEIVDPDPECPKCRGRGWTDQGICTCLKPRGAYGKQQNSAATAPAGSA